MDKTREPSAERLRSIKALAMDIDGVLTNGTVIPLADGDLLRVMDVKDSFAVRFAGQQGIITAIMSGGNTEGLRKRCLNLGIREENLHLGCRGKIKIFHQFCQDNGLQPSEVMYIGDDVADMQVLSACGIGVVPSDAAVEAIDAADFVSPYPGGRSCVRHAVEMLLKAKGLWNFDPEHFERYF